jgi:hemerythrin
MESFQWSNNFVTGLLEVDEQHHRLVDLINRFGTTLGESDSIVGQEMATVFDELADYADYHFKEEENLMQEVGLDERHCLKHRHAHTHFLEEVVRLRQELPYSCLAGGESLLKFLTHWLAYHILGTDQAMARQIKAVRSGVSATSACEMHERLSDGSLDPILMALDGLFHQVSARNRMLMELNQSLEAKVIERTQALSVANGELTGLVRRLETEKEASNRLSRELEMVNSQLEAMAMTDALTGLPNRRHALARLTMEWEASLPIGSPLACLMIDADGFKPINDSYGHAAGDRVLQELAGRLRNSARTDDLVCRLGGDEFFVLCPNTGLAGALHLAESIRQQVAALRVGCGHGEWRGSVSIGVAARNPELASADALLVAADEAVYRAKRGGRNRVAQ